MITPRIRSRRALGGVTLAVALLLILASHIAHPSAGLPIYDGFVTEDPYRYLVPPPGQLGDPTSFSGTVTPNSKGRLPDLIATTDESPPQAQIFAPEGTFTVPSGATSFIVSITPIAPPAPAPAGSHLVGNVYSFVFTTADGRSVPTVARKSASVVLRGVPGDEPTVIYEFVGQNWTALKSQTAGGTLRFANINAFGDFVLVAKGLTPSPIPLASGSPSAEPTPVGTPAPTAVIPSPTIPSATLQPTTTPQPSPSTAPVVVPQGPQPDQTPIVAIGIGVTAVAVIVGGFLLWRWRRARQQDWRTYR